MKFACAIVAGCVIFMFVIMWAVLGFSLYWQIQHSDITSPYMIRVYTINGETIDSVKVVKGEEMITKTKKVYYCEFCKKKSFRKDTMEKHEKHCTLNPDRICRLCGVIDIRPLIEKYKSLPITADSVSQILDECDCCPNCTLTVLRCIDAFNPDNPHIEFDYKKVLREWWDAKNEEDSYVYGER